MIDVRRWLGIAAALCLAMPVWANDTLGEDYDPGIAPASDEGEKAIRNFVIPEDMTMSLIAAEPMLANPVCFYIDHQGRIYVAETFRHHQGVTDMRDHREWLIDDLAARTVEDRLIAMKANLGADFAKYTTEHDRIRLLVDEDGDGVMDTASIFADGFKDALAGIGAGILTDGDDVYWTCIPELWKLRDENGDGVADTREVMSSGYGVHINFLGHDLHGLRKGPDGRIYFSIGDRGAYVKTKEGTIIDEPDTGAVFRCFPDGSGLEVVHRGLRNPQELVFDDYGNLFTGDNNSDGGDQARWVWIVDGGDSGWRIGWQWIAHPNARGPWNSEAMWEPYHAEQPAHTVPPILNIGAGPSGLAYYPGTGLPEEYKGHFFLCDFRGEAGMSLIHTFRVEPKGASYELVDRKDFARRMLATDVDFGVDGGVYFSDWVQGWDQPKKGRIYRIAAPVMEGDALVEETKRFLSEGMTGQSIGKLSSLLEHADQRVRFEAQWELARRGAEGLKTLSVAAQRGGSLMQRLHGIWGLWQLTLQGDNMSDTLVKLLDDPEVEVRANVARILREMPSAQTRQALVDALGDDNLRVRFHAASALETMPRDLSGEAFDSLVALAEENNNEDAYIRHGVVMGLLGQATVEELESLSGHSAPAVRLASLLALRRLAHPAVAEYLDDADEFLVLEAARAINDTPIPDAYADLAALADTVSGAEAQSEPLTRRMLNAQFRSLDESGAQGLGAYAANADNPAEYRVEALNYLAQWTEPYPLDGVDGMYRPLAGGAPDVPARVAANVLPQVLEDSEDDVLVAAAELAGAYDVRAVENDLGEIVASDSRKDPARIAALVALAEMESPALQPAITAARAAESSMLRLEAINQMAKLNPAEATPILGHAILWGGLTEKQRAIDMLGDMAHPSAGAMLADLIGQLAEGTLEPELQLDVLDAAERYEGGDVPALLASYREGLPKEDPMAPYWPALKGGDWQRGRELFFQSTEANCLRCHAIGGRGGGEVGPELTHVASRVSREGILESIVRPNAAIAEGFENVTLTLNNNIEYMGRVVSEDAETILLEIPAAQQEYDPFAEPIPHSEVDVVADDSGELAPPMVQVTVKKSDVAERTRNLSSMPEDFAQLVPMKDIRDLVAYLATQK